MVAWLLVALTTVGGAAASLYLRWRLQRAEDQVELWQTQSKRLTEELAGVHVAFRHERARLEGEIRVLRSEAEVLRRRIGDLVRGNPELAREYLRGVFQDAAAPGAADPAPHEGVPPVAPAGPAGGGGGERG
jgi:hypothetical protein